MPIDKVVSHRHFCSSTCEDLLALRLHDHICLIYETPEEQFDAILPYIRKGLESREKCVYVADDNTAAKVERRMRQAWPDFDAWVAKKALVIVESPSKAKTILDHATTKLDLSNRGYLKTIKIAQTIADIDGESEVGEAALMEALQYRSRA